MNRRECDPALRDDSISARMRAVSFGGTVLPNRRRTEAQTRVRTAARGPAGDGRSAGGCRGAGRHRAPVELGCASRRQLPPFRRLCRQAGLGLVGGGGGGRFGEGTEATDRPMDAGSSKVRRRSDPRPAARRQRVSGGGNCWPAKPPPAKRLPAEPPPRRRRGDGPSRTRGVRSARHRPSLPTMRASDSGPSRSSSSPRIERVGRAPVGAPDWARRLAARSPRSSTRARTPAVHAALQPLESGRRNAAGHQQFGAAIRQDLGKLRQPLADE